LKIFAGGSDAAGAECEIGRAVGGEAGEAQDGIGSVQLAESGDFDAAIGEQSHHSRKISGGELPAQVGLDQRWRQEQ